MGIIYKKEDIKMDISQMKNIVVLKDLPSNIVDEAIVILKNNSNIKKKEYTKMNKSEESENGTYDTVIKEAEYIVQDYIKNIEKNNETKRNINKINLKYKRLQIYSILFGIAAIICMFISIFK